MTTTGLATCGRPEGKAAYLRQPSGPCTGRRRSPTGRKVYMGPGHGHYGGGNGSRFRWRGERKAASVVQAHDGPHGAKVLVRGSHNHATGRGLRTTNTTAHCCVHHLRA